MHAKLPPHSIEAEQYILGALMLDGQAWDRIADHLSREDFYREDHRLIFSAIQILAQAGKPIDVLTVLEQLRDAQQLEEAGGLAYIGMLANESAGPANIEAYAAIVADKAMLRRVIATSTQMAELAYSGHDAGQILDEAQRLVLGLADVQTADTPTPIGEHLGNWYADFTRNYEAESEITGLSTGLCLLDSHTAGLQNGDLIILAARPSMGKSALALNIAEHCAHKLQKHALVFSLEMSIRSLLTRHIASLGRIPLTRLRAPKGMDSVDMANVTKAIERIHGSRLFIDDLSGLTIHKLSARARRVHRTWPLRLIIVDYLQLMSASGENRNRELEEITHGLKALAKDLELPVIALSQLARAGEKRPDRRPMLSDLRDSGAIEQDADVVLTLYRDEYYHPDGPHQGIAELGILKQRNGPTGRIELAWLPDFCRFENLAPETPGFMAREASRVKDGKQARGFDYDPQRDGRRLAGGLDA